MSNRGWRGFMNFLAFIAIIFIGAALLISALLNEGDFSRALNVIANVLAYIVVAFYSFWYAARKWERKQIWFMIAWTVAVVLIVVYLII